MSGQQQRNNKINALQGLFQHHMESECEKNNNPDVY